MGSNLCSQLHGCSPGLWSGHVIQTSPVQNPHFDRENITESVQEKFSVTVDHSPAKCPRWGDVPWHLHDLPEPCFLHWGRNTSKSGMENAPSAKLRHQEEIRQVSPLVTSSCWCLCSGLTAFPLAQLCIPDWGTMYAHITPTATHCISDIGLSVCIFW